MAAVVLMDLMKRMVKVGASDLHLKAGSYPGLRICGAIKQQTDLPRLTTDDTTRFAQELLTTGQQEAFSDAGDLDCSFAVGGLARFRVNVLTQRGSIALVLRVIPDKIPALEELFLPPICLELAMKPRGLVLVTGPTGSGKSTTLAAMVDYINTNVEGHILTMEDPLEFIHKDKKSYVTQRQIGSDCKSFQQALRRGLRQDPDVILIGELRDHETIELALTAAETGHLVMGTLHTTSAISTIDRIIDVFAPEAQDQIRVQLSGTLQGVVSQCLVPKIDGGRVAATEVLVCTDGVRSLIREGKTTQILNFLQTGSKYGMYTLEQKLIALVEAKQITATNAIAKANRPQDVRRAVAAQADSEAASPVDVDDGFGTGTPGGSIENMMPQHPQVPYQGQGHAPGPQGAPPAPPPQTDYDPQPQPGQVDRGGGRKRKGGLFDRR